MTTQLSPKHRWLIVADSLALPRAEVAYEHTWPKMLKNAFPDIDWIVRGQRASTTDRLLRDGDGGADCLEFYQPDGVILQLGICDCAPRLFKQNSLIARILFKLPMNMGKLISRAFEKTVGRQVKRAWVPIQRFESNLEQFAKRAATNGTQVWALQICPVGLEVVEKNPLLTNQIKRYNEALMQLASQHENFIYVQTFSEGCDIDKATVDGYHLNEHGARVVKAALVAQLQATHRSN